MDLAVSEVTLEGRVLFTGLVRDISDRRLLERELIRIQKEERQRIGQDLHDGLGQMLTGTGLITQQLARRLRAEGSPAADDAEEFVGLIREADQHARSLARGLVPVDLEQDGLPAALARLCRQAETLFGVECPLEVIGPAGQHLGVIPTWCITRRCQNLTFGGADKKTLYVAGGGTLLRIPMIARGFAGRIK